MLVLIGTVELKKLDQLITSCFAFLASSQLQALNFFTFTSYRQELAYSVMLKSKTQHIDDIYLSGMLISKSTFHS